MDKVLGLSKDALFDEIVTEARYHDGIWTVKTQKGNTVRCTYLVLATGSSYKKYIPDIQGIDSFKGKLIHAADWPREGLDVKGKRVGIIGNGATGVQLVQELGKEDCRLSVFIRTPICALPMQQRKLSDEEQETTKMTYEFLYDGAKGSKAGFPFKPPSVSFWDASPSEREQRMEDCWKRGGLAFNQGTYRGLVSDKEVNKHFYDFWVKKVRARINDPKKAQIVAPIPQQSWFATKRPSLEQDYYDVINRDNVEIVDLKAAPLESFEERGIRTAETLHELDIIVLATGYDSVTGSLLNMGLKDKNGVQLSERWRTGVRTHLGLMIPEMPNLFMSYSPQAPTSFANAPAIIEIQVDWIAEAIQKMREEELSSIEALSESAERWYVEVQRLEGMTLFTQVDSWYMGSNIPGKPRELILYLGGLNVYADICKRALKSWDGFNVQKASTQPRASL